jgi:hypothetical protein
VVRGGVAGVAMLAAGMALGGLAWHAGTRALEAPRAQVELAESLVSLRSAAWCGGESRAHTSAQAPRLTAPISTVVGLRPGGLCLESIEVELRAASDPRFDPDGATPLRVQGVATDDAAIDAYIALLQRHRFLGEVEEIQRRPSRCGGRWFTLELGSFAGSARPRVIDRVAGLSSGGGR